MTMRHPSIVENKELKEKKKRDAFGSHADVSLYEEKKRKVKKDSKTKVEMKFTWD